MLIGSQEKVEFNFSCKCIQIVIKAYTFFYLCVKMKIMEWEVMIKCIKTIKEKSRFALLYQITNGECKKETDNSSYFMAQTKIGYPVWVWTKNNISKNKIKEVQDKMKLL